jgi:hypothetical protein
MEEGVLERDTTNWGRTIVEVEQEFKFKSKSQMYTLIPYSSKWSYLFVQLSGGIDSALMLYLTAKVFHKIGANQVILPISFEVPTKAKSLQSARLVISKVRELTNYKYLRPGLEFHIPPTRSYNPFKNRFFSDTILRLFENFPDSFEFNGNTLNPPKEARQYFPDDDFRQIDRDRRETIYNSPRSASPHAMNDKSGIVALYEKENILNELAPLTLSCDRDLADIHDYGLDLPCGDCWWCHERAWGFLSNQLTDPADSHQYQVAKDTK